MVVHNRFSTRTEDRERVLRTLAMLTALMGTGGAAVLLTMTRHVADLTTLWVLGLGLAFGLGLALAALLWTQPRWGPPHTLLALATGALWLLLGFTVAPYAGLVLIVLGGMLAGIGVGAMATEPRGSPARIGPPREV